MPATAPPAGFAAPESPTVQQKRTATERGGWTCVACGFRGFWSGGPHDCQADASREPLVVIARALLLLEEAGRRRDVGDLTARDLERNARQLLRAALGVVVVQR